MHNNADDKDRPREEYLRHEGSGRRRLLSNLVLAGGSAGLLRALPDVWTSPLVRSVVLPAHAQTSPLPLALSCSAALEGEAPAGADDNFPDNTIALSEGGNTVNNFLDSFDPDVWMSGGHGDEGRLGLDVPQAVISPAPSSEQDVTLSASITGNDFELSGGNQVVTTVGGVADFAKVYLQDAADLVVDSDHAVTLTFSTADADDCVITLQANV